MNEKVRRHFELCRKLNKTYEHKNHDYGDSFHKTYLEEGLAMARIRLGDKYNRFCALSRKGAEQKVDDESIIDTLLDMANYAIMTVMELSEGTEDGVDRRGTMSEDTGVERGCCDRSELDEDPGTRHGVMELPKEDVYRGLSSGKEISWKTLKDPFAWKSETGYAPPTDGYISCETEYASVSSSDASTSSSESSGVSEQWLKRVSPEKLLEGYKQALRDGKAECLSALDKVILDSEEGERMKQTNKVIPQDLGARFGVYFE